MLRSPLTPRTLTHLPLCIEHCNMMIQSNCSIILEHLKVPARVTQYQVHFASLFQFEWPRPALKVPKTLLPDSPQTHGTRKCAESSYQSARCFPNLKKSKLRFLWAIRTSSTAYESTSRDSCFCGVLWIIIVTRKDRVCTKQRIVVRLSQ